LLYVWQRCVIRSVAKPACDIKPGREPGIRLPLGVGLGL
jgi:hypothetical protein